VGIPRHPSCTRSCVKLYEVSMGYINGAYHEDINDIWYPVQWGKNGMYANKPSKLDLINV
jgi:hypothetical protein